MSLRRRIILETELEGTEELLNQVIAIADSIDRNIQFSISQEIVPESISERKTEGRIMVPNLTKRRAGVRHG